MTSKTPAGPRGCGCALSRRHALTGALTVGVGVPFLAACGSGGDGATVTPSPSAGPLTTTSEITEGGGMIFADQNVVVTQPAAGEFKAFSSTCTHQSCTVSTVKDGLINCTCHGSSFSITDGSPTAGPASTPLPAVKITVTGDQISIA